MEVEGVAGESGWRAEVRNWTERGQGPMPNTTWPMDPPVDIPIDMQFNDGHLLSILGYSILFLLSALGNVTLLVVIVKRRCRRVCVFNRIDFMLFHLAVADLLVTFLMMPLEVVWAVTVSWRGGDALCRLMAFCRIFGLYLSSFVLVCLALDRYLAVKYPMQMYGSMRRSRSMVTVGWLMALCCSLPQAFIFHEAQHPHFRWYFQCVSFDSLSPRNQLIYNFFVMTMMYALPFVVILILYGGIVLELYKRTQPTSTTSVGKSEGDVRHGQSAGVDGLRRSGLGNLCRAKEKTLKMTVVIALIFVVCWSPYYAMCVWYWIDQRTAAVVDQKVQKALFLFACTNSTANPIVYGVFHLKSTFQTSSARRSMYGRDLERTASIYEVRDNLLNRRSEIGREKTEVGRSCQVLPGTIQDSSINNEVYVLRK